MNLFHIYECLRLEYVFHMKLELSLFLDFFLFQWLRTANAFDESSVYYRKQNIQINGQ